MKMKNVDLNVPSHHRKREVLTKIMKSILTIVFWVVATTSGGYAYASVSLFSKPLSEGELLEIIASDITNEHLEEIFQTKNRKILRNKNLQAIRSAAKILLFNHKSGQSKSITDASRNKLITQIQKLVDNTADRTIDKSALSVANILLYTARDKAINTRAKVSDYKYLAGSSKTPLSKTYGAIYVLANWIGRKSIPRNNLRNIPKLLRRTEAFGLGASIAINNLLAEHYVREGNASKFKIHADWSLEKAANLSKSLQSRVLDNLILSWGKGDGNSILNFPVAIEKLKSFDRLKINTLRADYYAKKNEFSRAVRELSKAEGTCENVRGKSNEKTLCFSIGPKAVGFLEKDYVKNRNHSKLDSGLRYLSSRQKTFFSINNKNMVGLAYLKLGKSMASSYAKNTDAKNSKLLDRYFRQSLLLTKYSKQAKTEVIKTRRFLATSFAKKKAFPNAVNQLNHIVELYGDNRNALSANDLAITYQKRFIKWKPELSIADLQKHTKRLSSSSLNFRTRYFKDLDLLFKLSDKSSVLANKFSKNPSLKISEYQYDMGQILAIKGKPTEAFARWSNLLKLKRQTKRLPTALGVMYSFYESKRDWKNLERVARLAFTRKLDGKNNKTIISSKSILGTALFEYGKQSYAIRDYSTSKLKLSEYVKYFNTKYSPEAMFILANALNKTGSRINAIKTLLAFTDKIDRNHALSNRALLYGIDLSSKTKFHKTTALFMESYLKSNKSAESKTGYAVRAKLIDLYVKQKYYQRSLDHSYELLSSRGPSSNQKSLIADNILDIASRSSDLNQLLVEAQKIYKVYPLRRAAHIIELARIDNLLGKGEISLAKQTATALFAKVSKSDKLAHSSLAYLSLVFLRSEVMAKVPRIEPLKLTDPIGTLEKSIATYASAKQKILTVCNLQDQVACAYTHDFLAQFAKVYWEGLSPIHADGISTDALHKAFIAKKNSFKAFIDRDYKQSLAYFNRFDPRRNPDLVSPISRRLELTRTAKVNETADNY